MKKNQIMKDYKHLAMTFNIARQNMEHDVLSSKEMYHLLTKVIGFGKDSQLLSLLSQKNIIRHVGHNQYMFPVNPVYYGKIQTVMQLHNKNKRKSLESMTLNQALRICYKYGYCVTKMATA